MISKGCYVQISKKHLGVYSELEGVVGEVLSVDGGVARVRIPNGIVDCELEALIELEPQHK